MKNNIDFYQHYATADQHPKFKMLRVQFGWAGEGKFWALNNRIAQAENCCLNISKKYNKAAIASDLDFNLNDLDEFISFLLDDCELIRECESGVITTDIVQENFQKVMVNREKARERKQRALEKVSKGSGELSKGSGDQNKKVKESKGKEKNTPLTPQGGKANVSFRIVDYLNRKTGSNFSFEAKATQRHIDARIKEGFTPDDFKTVIDFKCSQWLTDPEKQEFLRPITLFNSKFESYLNAAKRKIIPIEEHSTREHKTIEQRKAEEIRDFGQLVSDWDAIERSMQK